MANTKTPRNAQGQTYEEWLAQKVKLSRGSKYQIKLDEFIYGMVTNSRSVGGRCCGYSWGPFI